MAEARALVGGEQVEADELHLADGWLVAAGGGRRRANDLVVDHSHEGKAGAWGRQALGPVSAALVDILCREEGRGEQVHVSLTPAGHVDIAQGRSIVWHRRAN
ncbi:hypothetical protein RHODO2019_06500 [Rhodococcus antarcticus]|uniref:Uncharacterized protein n=1 Tax=Rhodococcus antarcticus TaxID=2987751 RepID=A0ABY6P353_9NOCA|nr:hypothetical protein [Rhodococcus antarcticus]UZJ26077.1 hypothetical protein RHODO2019_06500 [Rhodococcus antarcticus]